MGRVSNETRLVVKLAREKMQTERAEHVKNAGGDNVWVSGYNEAYRNWQNALESIITDLERRG